MDAVRVAYLDYVAVYLAAVLDAVADFLFSPGVLPFVVLALAVLTIGLLARILRL